MKAKTLLPLAVLCTSATLGLTPLFADHTLHEQDLSLRGQPWLLSRMMDATVKDSQGDTLGQIKDIIVDPNSGRASFAVIQLKGDVGPQGVYAPIPWTLLKPAAGNTEPRSFTANIDKDKFASSQKFFLQQWPDSNQAAWAPQVYSYYGLDYAGMGATGTGLDSNVAIGNDQYYYQYHGGMRQYGPTRADGTPIDNGTAPDGKGTFSPWHRY